jgi:hypothetical protein
VLENGRADERVSRGQASERAVCVCEAVSVEKRARRPPLPTAVVCPPGRRRRRRLAITAILFITAVEECCSPAKPHARSTSASSTIPLHFIQRNIQVENSCDHPFPQPPPLSPSPNSLTQTLALSLTFSVFPPPAADHPPKERMVNVTTSTTGRCDLLLTPLKVAVAHIVGSLFNLFTPPATSIAHQRLGDARNRVTFSRCMLDLVGHDGMIVPLICAPAALRPSDELRVVQACQVCASYLLPIARTCFGDARDR